MEQDSQKIINDRFKELPEQIREVIVSSGWEKIIRDIVFENKLQIDQGALIEQEVLLTMLGFETPEDFVNNLMHEAKIEYDLAQRITREVNERIFSLIKQKLISETEEASVKKEVPEPDRETILKEIEDPEETQLAIPLEPNPPAIQTNQPVQQTAPTQNQPQNTVAQKLQTPSVSEPKVVKIDPYREPF